MVKKSRLIEFRELNPDIKFVRNQVDFLLSCFRDCGRSVNKIKHTSNIASKIGCLFMLRKLYLDNRSGLHWKWYIPGENLQRKIPPLNSNITTTIWRLLFLFKITCDSRKTQLVTEKYVRMNVHE